MLRNGATPVPVQIMNKSFSIGSGRVKTPWGPRSVSWLPTLTSLNK